MRCSASWHPLHLINCPINAVKNNKQGRIRQLTKFVNFGGWVFVVFACIVVDVQKYWKSSSWNHISKVFVKSTYWQTLRKQKSGRFRCTGRALSRSWFRGLRRGCIRWSSRTATGKRRLSVRDARVAWSKMRTMRLWQASWVEWRSDACSGRCIFGNRIQQEVSSTSLLKNYF